MKKMIGIIIRSCFWAEYNLSTVDKLLAAPYQVIDKANTLITEHNELVKDNASLAENNAVLAKRPLEKQRNKDKCYHSR